MGPDADGNSTEPAPIPPERFHEFFEDISSVDVGGKSNKH